MDGRCRLERRLPLCYIKSQPQIHAPTVQSDLAHHVPVDLVHRAVHQFRGNSLRKVIRKLNLYPVILQIGPYIS
jgi:hypothetical protein